MPNLTLKQLLAIIVTFPIFYGLSYSVGGNALENYAKILLLAALLFTLLGKQAFSLDGLSITAFLKFLKQFAVFRDPFITISAIIDGSRTLLSWSLYNFSRHANSGTVASILLYLSSAFSIYSIPFLLKILTPFTKGYDLSIYGLTESGYSGIFQNPHNAGLTHAYACMVLLYNILFYRRNNISRAVLSTLFLVSAFAVYSSYTRTAWIVLAAGLGYLTLARIRYRGGFAIGLLAVAAVAVIMTVALSNQLILDRLTDRNIYTTGPVGSGRLHFWQSALHAWSGFTVPEKLFGIAREEMMAIMFTYTHLNIVGHNGLVDALVLHGIIGIVIEITLILFLANAMCKKGDDASLTHLRRAAFLGYLLIFALQGGYFFYPDTFVFLLAGLSHAHGQPRPTVATPRHAQ